MTTWIEALQYRPDLRNIEQWPPVALDHLDGQRLACYRRRYRAVEYVLRGQSLRVAARIAGLSAGQLSKLLTRCLGTDEQFPHPALTLGLVPGARVRPLTIDTGRPIKSGAWAFERLLCRYPSIRDGLDQYIKDDLANRSSAERLTPQSFHTKLKTLLREAGVRADEYPYTTRLCAQESCRRYLHRRRRELNPRSHRRTRLPDQGRPQEYMSELFHTVELDEHRIDVESAAKLGKEISSTFKALRIKRFWLAIAVDRASDAIVGMAYDLNGQPTQYSLLALLESIERGSEACEIDHLVDSPIPPFLPQDLYETLRCIPSEIRLDNLMAHYSNLARDIIVERWIATLCLGTPGLPLARQIVEATFRKIAQIIHRYRSTSGVSVTDPNRESRRLKRMPPSLSVQVLLSTLATIIREYNQRPVPRLYNRSPVQELLHQYDQTGLRRQLVLQPGRLTSIWEKQDSRCVKYYGGTSARINYLLVQYTGPALTPMYADQTITVVHDIRDVRTVRAYTERGEYIGELHAPKKWCRHAHTERTRKELFDKHRKLIAHSTDPIGDLYDRQLSAKGSSSALAALRLTKEAHCEVDETSDESSAARILELATRPTARRFQLPGGGQ